AAILLLGNARRRDTGEAVGALSRETVERDRSARAGRADAAVEAPSGRAVEQSVAVERRAASTAVVTRPDTNPVAWVPPDPEIIGVNRRQFLNRSMVGVSSFSLATLGVAMVGFLWPSSSGGFGSKLRVGSFDEINQKISDGGGFAYYPEGRMWVTAYPQAALDKARNTYSAPELAGMEAGFVALYQKCVHLGCRVPQCLTSQWFECPCHGSKYNQVGEKKAGPAPRGLDRFVTEVDGNVLLVNTGVIIQGPPIGVNTTGQEAEGPACITGGGNH
ncbi:MAG: ubiquinol-cytochrome c reductase iron-sulfur subunit, partial [Actinomycetota bacterium]|nr:ubiquinol-cytochrome c reductase iron-sulfur subunit [Actinomycetota bacterium]